MSLFGKNLPALTLHTERLTLRLPTQADAPALHDYYLRNRERLEPLEPTRPENFYTLPYWQDRVTQAQDAFRKDVYYSFIFNLKNNEHVSGVVNFTSIIRGSMHGCRLGYSIDGAAEGQGLMREALAEAIRYMFRVQNLHRVRAAYQPHNIRSAKLLASLGFVEEGLAKDYLLIDGHWRDHVLTALTNPFWKP